jgi:AcrR family transcriptional regulator
MVRQARAQATRIRLLDATVEALVETGYAGTTTQEVRRRAGCSRGTLLYHFPKREDLLVAALEHVLSSRVEGFVAEHVAEHDALPTPDVDTFIQALWTRWQGPALIAWLELAVAARTNATLREPMRQTMLEFDQQILAAFRTLKPVGELPPELEEGALFFTFAVLNGLAVGRSYDTDDQSKPVLGLLSTLARMLQTSELMA